MTWQETAEQTIKKSKKKVVEIDLEKKSISYSNDIKKHENITKISGDEEIARAFLINRLVNELGYKARALEIEKRFTTGRKSKNKGENDIILYDNKGNTYIFLETKKPDKFEEDLKYIEGQLFNLAALQDKSSKIKYLVWYTTNFQDGKIVDKAIIIDYKKYPNYAAWQKAGEPSVGNEIPAGYGKPEKKKWIKGKNDLVKQIDRDQINQLATKLHNFLWGGGGTSDTEIFYSLVNIILAKIQDEGEKTNGKVYDFQVFGYEGNLEDGEEVYKRLNELYKRALKRKMGEKNEKKLEEARIINRNKFQLNKLVYTVQALEQYSFIEGRNSLDGRDILGDFFETITRDGFKQTKGQFFTPNPIVKFLIYAMQIDKLAINILNEEHKLPCIIDPSLGSGTFLVESMKVITKELKYKQREKLLDNIDTNDRFYELFEPKHKENRWAREYMYGIEHNFDLGTSSKVNMILHGDGSTNIIVNDGLLPFRLYSNNIKKTKDRIEFEKPEKTYFNKDVNGAFDVVISNPPFSVDLDGETKRFLPQSFLFADKKNSENLFIERYYQLLKPKGRLGVVLPESIFDTTENKYIRLFIFKYFHVQAVVSLPQITFEPYTSTKTSLLFAQRKETAAVEKWQTLWDKYSKEWNELKTRVGNYVKVYIKKNNRNKYSSIKNHSIEEVRKNINRFLKDFLVPDDNNLSIENILHKYNNEIEELSKFDKDTKEVFGYVNIWWVFGEVAKEQDYEIFMAEVENVGYKRTKRGEKIKPNELYDEEIAPQEVDKVKIIKIYDEKIGALKTEITKIVNEIQILEKKHATLEDKGKSTTLNTKRIENEREKHDRKIEILEIYQANKEKIIQIIDHYYDYKNNKWIIKNEFYDRTDTELLIHFQSGGLLENEKSSDVLLRKRKQIKLLDIIRKEVTWK